MRKKDPHVSTSKLLHIGIERRHLGRDKSTYWHQRHIAWSSEVRHPQRFGRVLKLGGETRNEQPNTGIGRRVPDRLIQSTTRRLKRLGEVGVVL